MRIGVRTVPWLLAVAGLIVPLVGSGFVTWAVALAWLAVLTPVWLFGGRLVPTRAQRIAAALLLLPVLVVLAWEGGWWLIPADLAWLAIEIADRGLARAGRTPPKAEAIPSGSTTRRTSEDPRSST